MSKNREIKIATITVTIMRRKKHNLLPGWEYGTNFQGVPTEAIRPQDKPTVIEIFEKVCKAL